MNMTQWTDRINSLLSVPLQKRVCNWNAITRSATNQSIETDIKFSHMSLSYSHVFIFVFTIIVARKGILYHIH